MTTTLSQHLSFSQVKQLRSCSWQYKLERLDRVPSRPSVPAVAGTAIHSGTELADERLGLAEEYGFTRGDLIEQSLDAALDALDAEVEKHEANDWPTDSWSRFGRATKEKPKGECIDWFRTVGIPNSISAYIDWRLANPEFVLADVPGHGPGVEVPFNYYIGGQMVRGFIDRIFTHAEFDGYIPLDIKSGLKPKTDEQLGLYGAALREALGWDITWGYFIYGLKSGEAKLTPPIDLRHWTKEKLSAVYLPAKTQIELKLFVPNPGDTCRICSVSDQCDFTQSLV